MSGKRRYHNGDGFNFDYVPTAERVEQAHIVIERHMKALWMVLSDFDEDTPDHKRFDMMLQKGEAFSAALKAWLDDFYGEKISPDAPMLGGGDNERG